MSNDAPYKITSAQMIDALGDLKRLPSFSNILSEFDRLVLKPEGAHIEEVVELVMMDPRLSAGILQVVNSARYSPGFMISDVSQAVARLGVTDIRVMIVALNFRDLLGDAQGINKNAFLQHGLVSAFIARKLAPKFHVDPYDAFMMGLLHEVGLYMMALYHPEGFKELSDMSMYKLTRLLGAEKAVFGVLHPAVGAQLIRKWHFSKLIVMGVLGHHSPVKVDREYQNAAYMTQLAEAGAFYLGYYNGLVTTEKSVLTDSMQAILKRTGLNEDEFVDLLASALREAQETGFVG
ncbi:HDOD domain-containing protein [Thiosulfativibrio zosterae]|uniref:Histidine kinase n=1 Tax=Thiosulfativibrio zosterae TaxID=2675053 RepID=A0A6F8PLN3_9GAMM|nr:HDOD domain-containing protein [Thiosulfativibrio zosterae]BBP42996.1 histidine kinase [Thiosulfativibrio zosterae]